MSKGPEDWPGLASADVRRALADVGLLDELRRLPDGLATRLSSTGAPLSLSQARRLMLARAIVGRPRVLVIDDLLDDLDADARQQTAAALLDPNRRWTLIVLSRSDWIHDGFDRVVSLDELDPQDRTNGNGVAAAAPLVRSR